MTLSWPKLVIAWLLVAAGALAVRTGGLFLAGQSPTLLNAAMDVTLVALWAAASPLIFRSAQRFPVRLRSPMPNVAIHVVLGTSFIIASNVAIRLPMLWRVDGLRLLVAETSMGLATFYPAAIVCYGAVVLIGQWLRASASRAPEVENRDAPQNSSASSDVAPENVSDRENADRLVIREWNRVHFIALDDIDWVEAANNHVVVHANARKYKGRERISDVEARLDGRRFVRVHRSAIVRIDKIREVQPLARGDQAVILRSGQVVRVARSRKQELESALGTQL